MQFLRVLFVMALFFPYCTGYAQPGTQGNLWHLHEKFQNSSQPIVLYVSGNLEDIYHQSLPLQAKYRYSFRGYHSFVVSGNAFQSFIALPAITQFIIEGGQGHVLVNKSRENTRANMPVVYRSDTLEPYTGKGVLMGIIDSGIDFNHPDFKSKNGKTRVLKLWDQTRNADSTLRPTYGYGEVYDSSNINGGTCPHIDPNSYHGHGTMVTGIAAGNGLSVPDSVGDYRGYATQSDMLIVATNFSANNWTQTIADAVDWIFKEADQLNRPCVINISAGSYLGSHDGKDLPARYIDSLMNAKPGRLVVGAAGNAGGVPPFHLKAKVNGDTSFTWFKVNPSTGFGGPAVFAELWADTAQFNNISFSIGATDTTNWLDTIYTQSTIHSRLDTLITLPLGGGAQLITWAERQNDLYLLQFLVTKPNAAKYYKFQITGRGEYNCWGASWMGISDMVRDKLPNSSVYPAIKNYQLPDSLQSIVSSWNCHPNVLSVANYNNRLEYENIDGGFRQTVDFPVLGIGPTSSRGPNREGVLKPDLAAPGNFTLTSGRLVDVNYLANTPSQRYKLAKGGYHFTNGGTSMAAPVVSGIAALLMEKCPKMSSAELRKALLQTTFSDSFTQQVPNIRWGRGKVDANAALHFTHPYDTLQSSTGILAFCEGNSLNLGLGKSLNTVNYWLHGDTGVQNLTVDSTNFMRTYQAYFVSAQGCSGYTDSAVVTMNDKPKFKIDGDTVFCLEDGDTLFAQSSDTSLFWRWNTGDTTQFLVINSGGLYKLIATSSEGCSDSSSHSTHGILCYVGIRENTKNNTLIYPNPSRGEVFVKMSEPSTSIRLIDSQGKIVSESQAPLKQFHFTDLPKGIYSLQIENYVYKIVVLE